MRRALHLIFAAAATAAACASLAKSFAPAPVRDRIKLPHEKHVRGQVECLQCHEKIYDATALEGRFLPREDICLGCHGKEKEKGNCGFCHTDPTAPLSYGEREWTLKVSHTKHIELVKEDCSRCHTALSEPGRNPMRPAMNACMSCHEHQEAYDQGECGRCHVDLKRYALEPISAFSHRGDFVARHRLDARTSAETCMQCHDQSFCGDCHLKTTAARIEIREPERPERDFIHRDDFISRHSIEAASDSARCQRCHGTSSCERCHERQRLTPLAADPRNPHPPDWARVGSANAHARAARENIELCASCHDQGPRSICIDCHRVGGIGGNPHPASWLGRHRHQEIQTNGMCLYCHS